MTSTTTPPTWTTTSSTSSTTTTTVTTTRPWWASTSTSTTTTITTTTTTTKLCVCPCKETTTVTTTTHTTVPSLANGPTPAPTPPPPPMECYVWGSSHFGVTFADAKYDFMGIGVYEFATAAGADFKVQVFKCPWTVNQPGASSIVAVALRTGGHTISIYGDVVTVDGAQQPAGQKVWASGITVLVNGTSGDARVTGLPSGGGHPEL